MRSGYFGISYSDGDDVEQRIARIIDESNDLSVFSSELRHHCTDWPSLYHLSSQRANILRPFENIFVGNVLEIGAGCGAITRYLGECGADVLALEGSLRRAAIARSRTRDLNNVTVLAERFDDFETDCQFDVITLIGVLEYANLFTSSSPAHLIMLKRVRSLLKPQGRLIIAIENQLGLKYFAGAAEDHIGQPMYGIEDRYRCDQPVTFGRNVLYQLLQQAGFDNLAFFAPFPDYKLPSSIISESGAHSDDFDASALAWQSVRRDPQLPQYCNFSMELAWPAVFANGLSIDLANSLLIMASPQASTLMGGDQLAWHYSTDRLPQYCKETRFVRSKTGKIEVLCRHLALKTSDYHDQQKVDIEFVPQARSLYYLGKPLSLDLMHIVTRDGWTFNQVGEFLRRYVGILKSTLQHDEVDIDINSLYAKLPGHAFDLIPQNIIMLSDDTFEIIDREWVLRDPIELGYLFFRSLFWFICSVSRIGITAYGPNLTRQQFVIDSLNAAGYKLLEKDFFRYVHKEVVNQQAVTGGTIESIELTITSLMKQTIPRLNLSQAVIERDGQIASLNQAVIERDAQIAILYESSSWKITAPLRKISRLIFTLFRIPKEMGKEND